MSGASFILRAKTMLAFKVARSLGSKAAKPSLYAALLGSFLWLAVDLADGASDRFHTRLDQAKTSVMEPADQTFTKVMTHASKLWESIEANPGPSILAIGLFVITVIYHKRRGASTVEALKAVVLKTTPAEPENPVLVKIQKEALQNQMYKAYDKLSDRSKVLPEEIGTASAHVQRAEVIYNKARDAALRAEQEFNRAKELRESLLKEQADAKVTMAELEEELSKAV